MRDLENKCRSHHRSYQKKLSMSNLTVRQWKISDDLNDNNGYIGVKADKNLGRAAFNRLVYNTKGLSEHVRNMAVCKRLTKKKANDRNNVFRYKIGVFSSKHKDAISPVDHTLLHKAMFKYQYRLVKFRISIKIHKKNLKMRVILCCTGTLINCLSRWLDF